MKKEEDDTQKNPKKNDANTPKKKDGDNKKKRRYPNRRSDPRLGDESNWSEKGQQAI